MTIEQIMWVLTTLSFILVMVYGTFKRGLVLTGLGFSAAYVVIILYILLTDQVWSV